MLKHSLAAGLLACVAFTPMVLAQDAKPAQQQEQSAKADSIDFIKAMESEQFRSSNLVGKTVYNLQDENIGEINDLILEQNGQVAGVVIGVGGFLGIGESDVAVPMDALKFVPDNQAMASSSGSDAGSASGAATGRSAAETEKQPGAAGQPSGTSTGAALPNQNTQDQGSAQESAAAGAGQAKQDPAAQSGASGSSAGASGSAAGSSAQADRPAGAGSAAGSGASGSSSASANAGSDAAGDRDWLDGMKVVLNTSREDLTDAPKLGEDESGAQQNQQNQPAKQ